MTAILEGLRVVECSAFIAAPLGGMTLAQLGAEVIRVDPIGGGLDYRRWPVTRDGVSLYWAGLNKGKKSIAIDLAGPRGRELVAALAAAPGRDAGIFVTNFPARGWLAYETLAAKRPDLIMVAISGHADGTSAVDYTVNAAVGFPMATGPVGHDGPVNHVLPAWDIATGLTAAIGLLAAERRRARTGEGALVRLALADVAMAMAGHLGHLAEVEIDGAPRPRHGNVLFGAFGRDFAVADGARIMVVAITPGQWSALLAATGLAAQIAEIAARIGLDFAREGDRFIGREALFPLFAQWIGARTLAAVSAAFDAHGVCWDRYRDFAQALDDPRFEPLLSVIDQPGVGRHRAPSSALDFAGLARLKPAPAPRLGEHTDRVLSERLGLSHRAIGELRAAGVVA